ncbi:MAG: pseudouridine synthase [Nitrospirota bacterium]
MPEERLQKLMARAGIASRRASEQLILDGEVTVNGRVVTELGTKADPDKDHVKVRGKLLQFKTPLVYAMLHKPKGYVTTMSDPEGRPTIVDLIRGLRGRVFPIGRLDFDTEGLLLLTNDGELANALMHPSGEVPKIYAVKIKGKATDEEIGKLEAGGIYLGPGRSAPCRVRRMRQAEQNEWLEITLHEGKKRQIRVMLERLDHSVLKLIRTHYAGIPLGTLPRGEARLLTPAEVKRLKTLAVGSSKTEKRDGPPRRAAAGTR